MAAEESGPNSFGMEVQRMSMYFYADDGPLSSTHPEWLQGVFDFFTDLFYQVGVYKNSSRTVGMVCQS